MMCNMSKIRAIRTEGDYHATLVRIDGLMDAELGTPEGEELDVLTDLVELYEARHVPMGCHLDRLSLETAKLIEDQFAQHHKGGRTQRLAIIQTLVRTAILAGS